MSENLDEYPVKMLGGEIPKGSKYKFKVGNLQKGYYF